MMLFVGGARAWLPMGLLAIAGTIALPSARAASPSTAQTDRQTREEAIRSIPFNELTPDTQRKLQGVVSNPSIFRRMPVEMIDCDPDLYLFLVRYPEVVVNIWRVMEITNVSVQRTGPFTLKTFDGAGTHGRIELVYGTRDTHVVFAEGYYEGPMFKRKITGRCVMVLKTAYGRGEDGRPKISNQLDMFIQIDNMGAEIIARTLHPMVGKTADLNFAESAGFIAQLSRWAETNGSGMQRLSARLKEIEPAVREQFARVATVVNERSSVRPAAVENGQPRLSQGSRGAE